MAVGAFALVLGLALIPVGSFVVNTGLFRTELQFSQASSQLNATSMSSQYAVYANEGEAITIVGAILAPVGAAILVYGFFEGRTAGKGKQVASPAEPTQA